MIKRMEMQSDPIKRCEAEMAAIESLPRDLPLYERLGAEHGWLDWWEEREKLMEMGGAHE